MSTCSDADGTRTWRAAVKNDSGTERYSGSDGATEGYTSLARVTRCGAQSLFADCPPQSGNGLRGCAAAQVPGRSAISAPDAPSDLCRPRRLCGAFASYPNVGSPIMR